MVILPTGSGKTKVGVMAAAEFNDVVVVTSRLPLVDNWKKEFLKWNVSPVKLTILTIQSAYKRKVSCDLLIIDEAHRASSDKYSKVFTNIECKALLCLTATLPSKKEARDYLMGFVKRISYESKMDDMVKIKAVSKYVVYNLKVSMDGKTKAKYKVFNEIFMKGITSLSKWMRTQSLRHYKTPFDLARDAVNDREKLSFLDATVQSEIFKAASDFWSGMTLRKHAVYDNLDKIKIAKAIISKFPNKK